MPAVLFPVGVQHNHLQRKKPEQPCRTLICRAKPTLMHTAPLVSAAASLIIWTCSAAAVVTYFDYKTSKVQLVGNLNKAVVNTYIKTNRGQILPESWGVLPYCKKEGNVELNLPGMDVPTVVTGFGLKGAEMNKTASPSCYIDSLCTTMTSYSLGTKWHLRQDRSSLT